MAFNREHQVRFVMYVRLRGLSHEDAEDVVSETFLTLYRVRKRLFASDNPVAFAFKVLRDTFASHCRKSDRAPASATIDGDSIDAYHHAPDAIEPSLRMLDVTRAIDKLPERQAECARLSLIFDYETAEIARYLGISPSTVTSHLAIARSSLRSLLGDYREGGAEA
ncbi:RNA polymerase sigma factor [Actinomadura macrotermitis]|uniref:Uncharacterized protein n=1 Tax=Actinomadura macrotermitis TaxID=2585200 RepID=A0A7K0C193_9ACTN|nr:sigma-70 family RNA polymerase sigma factor [Actinomadura macrotermitis]MQY07231.1 hypothetical protein [Actinomadura macrotermitis]